MTTDMSIFTPALLAELGLTQTPGRTEWCAEWARWEGTNALWNPFATTLDTNPTWRHSTPFFNNIQLPNGNVLHVMNYKDLASGVAATAQTIRQSNFGLILESMKQQVVLYGVAAVMASTWGTTGFANRLSAGWTPSGWTSDYNKQAPVFTEAQIAYIQGMFDAAMGPTWLALMRQTLGLDESTWGSSYQAAVQQVRDLLLSGSLPAHRHELQLAVASTGPVIR